jgi:hypothetical protein
MEGHTFDAFTENSIRASNEPLRPNENKIGIGHRLGMTFAGLMNPLNMPAGKWTHQWSSGNPASFDEALPFSQGSDRIIPSNDDTGTGSDSPSTKQNAAVSNNYTLTGNNLHTNGHDFTKHITSTNVFPIMGWSTAAITPSGFAHKNIAPNLINEISEQRQLISKEHPRIGLTTSTVTEDRGAEAKEYRVVKTLAASLNSDLAVGQAFPISPSYITKTYFVSKDSTKGTIDSPFFAVQPVVPVNSGNGQQPPAFALEQSSLNGNITEAGATVKYDAKNSALDIWNVRGLADLPPWGGVFILRKTYLQRSDDIDEIGSISNAIAYNDRKASHNQKVRKTIDYIVRPVRPNKIYAYCSEIMQDGWLMGPKTLDLVDSSNPADYWFHRDKRYGIFELNNTKGAGLTEPLISSHDYFKIEYPDVDDIEEVYHLIPSAGMLEMFKSDAVRKINGEVTPLIEPRYSQTTHPGGGEKIHMSESRYSNDSNNIGGDFALDKNIQKAEILQSEQAMRHFPSVKVLQQYVATLGNTFIIVDDGSLLPSQGDLMCVGFAGAVHYTEKTGNILQLASSTVTSPLLTVLPSLIGKEMNFCIRSPTMSNPAIRQPTITGVLSERASLEVNYPIVPTFVDNAVSLMKNVSREHYKPNNNAMPTAYEKTSITYEGLISYQPNDFRIRSKKKYDLKDGGASGRITGKGDSKSITHDGRVVTESDFPKYMFDAKGKRWKINSVYLDGNLLNLQFNNLEGESLEDAGIELGKVGLGQYLNFGIRTTDAAMLLLSDAAHSFAGINLQSFDNFYSSGSINYAAVLGHPSFRSKTYHSNIYTGRNASNINVLEVIRNLSQIDGRQLVSEKSGTLIFSTNVFTQSEKRIGMDNGVRDMVINKMFDSPNMIILSGDTLAENESILVEVKDLEKTKKAAGKGGKEEVIRALTQKLPGLKSEKGAFKIAINLLSRVENGAPMVTLTGLLNATSINAGEIVKINLPNHGLVGDFAVFEARHDFASATSDFIVSQYAKGLEGIIADLQTSIQSEGGKLSTSENVKTFTLSTDANVIAVHRITARSNNHTKMIIGHRSGKKLGSIGVNSTTNKRGNPVGMSKSRPFVVK